MKTFIYPLKDATIYENEPLQNTGIDQIIELNHILDENNVPYNSRILMQFDLTTISQSIASGQITNPSFFLRLFSVAAWEIPSEYTIDIFPVSGSWDMGIGKQKHFPITKEGVSWYYRDGYNDNTNWLSSSYNANSTGSYVTESGGGNWYYNYSASQSYNYETIDLRSNISNIVNGWLSGSIDNHGIIIKRSDEDEQSIDIKGNIKFFSNESNTIYIPRLEVSWNDSTFNTGSLDELTNEEIILSTNLKIKYKDGSRQRIRVDGRPLYPVRSFSTSSNYIQDYYLPTSSYYQIRDAHTDDILIDYDSDTNLNCDSSGNYFDLWLDAFQPERFYKVVFKIERNNLIEYYDNDYKFKVVK